MIDPLELQGKAETAVLIGLITDHQDAEHVKEYLDELEFLATTADIVTLKRFTQKLHKPDGRTYVGSGKLAEVKAWMEEHGADCIIFDDELSASQQRNLEKAMEHYRYFVELAPDSPDRAAVQGIMRTIRK